MSTAPMPEIEKQLAELTAWTGPAPGLWRRALVATGAAPPRRVGWRVLLYGSAAVAAVVLFAALTPSLHRARTVGRATSLERTAGQSSAARRGEARGGHPGDAAASEGTSLGREVVGAGGVDFDDVDALVDLAMRETEWYALEPEPTDSGRGIRFFLGSTAGEASAGRRGAGAERGGVAPREPAQPQPSGAADEPRHVVRKAVIELDVADVRAASLKAGLLISEARGEYVENSAISGTGEHSHATLTLRVAADRLSEVLNQLRQLGDVRTENTSGEDVTTQVVDLESRLRNEQRAEEELLKLFETRQDATLDQVLQLRRAIADVRQTIERLTAQRERLARLTSLATVLVIIRPADAPTPAPPGLLDELVGSLSRAWQSGARFLIGTLALVVGVLVGGLPWWVLLVVAVLLLRAYLRRREHTA